MSMSMSMSMSFIRASSFPLLSPLTGPPITLSLPLLPARRSLLD